jgi:hypothetical protein
VGLKKERERLLKNLDFKPQVKQFSQNRLTSHIYAKNKYVVKTVKLYHKNIVIKPLKKIIGGDYFQHLESKRQLEREKKKELVKSQYLSMPLL